MDCGKYFQRRTRGRRKSKFEVEGEEEPNFPLNEKVQVKAESQLNGKLHLDTKRIRQLVRQKKNVKKRSNNL